MGICNCIFYFTIVYISILALFLSIPELQGHVVVLSWLNSPWSRPDEPFRYWINENQVSNFYIKSESVSLGAWIVGAQLKDIKKGSRVFVYVHGNSKDRSEFHRVRTYKIMSKIYPVIAFDYSCFSDSSCRHSLWSPPSEDELVQDLKIVIDFIHSKGVAHKDIGIMGHSLGTAIASKYLALHPQVTIAGLMLLAPMASVPLVAFDYPVVPLLKPLTLLSHELQMEAMRFVHIKLNSTLHLPKLNMPIFLIHGCKDIIVPVEHSKILFNAINNRNYDLSHRGFPWHKLETFDKQYIMDWFKKEKHIDWDHPIYKQSKTFEYYKNGKNSFLNLFFATHNDIESFDLFEEYFHDFADTIFPDRFKAPKLK